MTVEVIRIGSELAVVIPNSIARDLGLNEGMTLQVTTDNGSLLISRQSPRQRRPIEEIVAEIIPADYRRRKRELAGWLQHRRLADGCVRR